MISRAGLAALAVAATVSSAHASTITPDMWVYDLSGDISYVGGLSIRVEMRLPAGSDVPPGCSVRGTLISGDSWVECDLDTPTSDYVFFEGEVFELDLSKKLEWLSSDWWDTTVAFNEDRIVCHGPIECRDSYSTNDPLEQNYETGRLSYITSALFDDADWNVFLDPAGGSFDGSQFGLGVSGTWDYGWFRGLHPFGGDVYVRGSAVLVQAPSVVPLPAAGWMLLSALGLVVGLTRRQRSSVA